MSSGACWRSKEYDFGFSEYKEAASSFSELPVEKPPASLSLLKVRRGEIENDPHFDGLLTDYIYATAEDTYSNTFTPWKKTACTLVCLFLAAVPLLAIVAFILQTVGIPLNTLFQHMNIQHLAIGLFVTSILVAGALIVIMRAMSKKEALLGKREYEVTHKDGTTQTYRYKKEIAFGVVTHGSTLEVKEIVTDAPHRGDFYDIGNSLESVLLSWKATKCGTIRVSNSTTMIDVTLKNGSERQFYYTLLSEAEELPAKVSLYSDREKQKYLCDAEWTKGKKSDTLRWEETERLPAYVDRSTLVNGKGKAYLYRIKDLRDHYQISTAVSIFGSPFYMLGAVVRNLFRTLIVPVYALIQYLREQCTGEQLYSDQRPFDGLDWLKEVGYSLLRVVQAPFYALAYAFAGFYSFVQPMEGRKLGAYIEEDWNDGVSFAESLWTLPINKQKQNLYQGVEGGWGPNDLGFKGYYSLAGCWQPIGIIEYSKAQKGAGFYTPESTKAYYLPAAIDPTWGAVYTVKTREAIINEPLITEYISLRQKIEALESPSCTIC